jgi:hypothetical protein
MYVFRHNVQEVILAVSEMLRTNGQIDRVVTNAIGANVSLLQNPCAGPAWAMAVCPVSCPQVPFLNPTQSSRTAYFSEKQDRIA